MIGGYTAHNCSADDDEEWFQRIDGKCARYRKFVRICENSEYDCREIHPRTPQ